MADRIVIYHTASGPDVETPGEFLEAKAAERVEVSEHKVAGTREKQLRFKDIEWKKNGKTTWTWQNPLLRLVFTEYQNYDELFAEFSFNGIEHGCGGKSPRDHIHIARVKRGRSRETKFPRAYHVLPSVQSVSAEVDDSNESKLVRFDQGS